MDHVRFGLSIRALRRRRGWTQQQLAERAGLSRSAVSRIECGEGDRLAMRILVRVADVLGARMVVRLQWHGEELDRLLDGDHARLVEWVVARLTALGWVAVPEVTFHVRGERGSIDVLAWHPASGSLLVVEVKTVVPDMQAMLSSLDRKTRLAVEIARERGWPPGPVSRLLVLPDDRTARRRVDTFAATFERVLPARTIAVRRWLAAPAGRLAGIAFVSGVTRAGARHRVAGPRRRLDHAPGPGSTSILDVHRGPGNLPETP